MPHRTSCGGISPFTKECAAIIDPLPTVAGHTTMTFAHIQTFFQIVISPLICL